MPVFISYSSKDSAFVDKLCQNLVAQKVHVWIDRWEMKPGDSLVSSIQTALEKSGAIIVVLSPSYTTSNWCIKELNAGLIKELEDAGNIIIPVLIAIGDYIPLELEIGHERNFLSFAGIKPASFPMIPREVQFAEKLHAYTMPRSVPNSRVRDLVDMVLLIKEGKMAHSKMVSALKAVFTRRKTHAAPEVLDPAPSKWEKIFSEMAEDCGLKMDMASGFKLLNRIYNDLHT